jgi:hypothetical protein
MVGRDVTRYEAWLNGILTLSTLDGEIDLLKQALARVEARWGDHADREMQQHLHFARHNIHALEENRAELREAIAEEFCGEDQA